MRERAGQQAAAAAAAAARSKGLNHLPPTPPNTHTHTPLSCACQSPTLKSWPTWPRLSTPSFGSRAALQILSTYIQPSCVCVCVCVMCLLYLLCLLLYLWLWQPLLVSPAGCCQLPSASHACQPLRCLHHHKLGLRIAQPALVAAAHALQAPPVVPALVPALEQRGRPRGELSHSPCKTWCVWCVCVCR